jgi:galacturan 1,4-alpha-galacturonidase
MVSNHLTQWSTDTSYWLGASLDVGYQNQSTAWILGGDNMRINGFGYGTIDGNGQTWYNLVKGISNYPRRPHGITFNGLTNSVVQGVRFVQSQMW